MSDQETYNETAARAFAKAIFAAANPIEQDETDEPQKPGNVVPGEGNNPTSQAHDLHDLVKSLFYPDPPDA